MAEYATHFASPISPVLTDTTLLAPPPDKILQGVVPPSPITGLPNGTPKTVSALGLPASIDLTTDLGIECNSNLILKSIQICYGDSNSE